MNILTTLIVLLKKPFPEEENNKNYFLTVFLISLFVTLFLFIFQPFGLANEGDKIIEISLGFGVMTFVGTLCFDFIISYILKLKSNLEKFTFGHWIIYVMGILMSISLANFLFMKYYYGMMDWSFFPQMIMSTIAICIFTIFGLGAISLLRQEKKYVAIADEINQHKSHSSITLKAQDRRIYDISLDKIRYVEALQNYVKIGYIDANGLFSERTERATLTSLLEELEDSSIIKCHRSYLVNRDAIHSFSGNAQGLLLTLTETTKRIPVSRMFVPLFR